MLAENAMATANICFLVTLSQLFSAYILHGQTTNFDNDGDTRVQLHHGDEGV